MVYWCYGDTTYRVNGGVPIDPSTALINSVDKGIAYGMKYIEIYRKDVLNLVAATHYAHTVLRPAAFTHVPRDLDRTVDYETVAFEAE
jgi:hypothetical protein